VKSVRFHGAIVASPSIRGSFWDRVDVSREHIHLRPWLRKNIVVDRDLADSIEYEQDRGPFTWATNVYFRFSDGTYSPKLFVPARPQKLRNALGELGWPVKDRPTRRSWF
jgi:hypothetical protein